MGATGRQAHPASTGGGRVDARVNDNDKSEACGTQPAVPEVWLLWRRPKILKHPC